MSVDHYENFPVASWCLPQNLRKPIGVIYAFARSADDLADEGEMSNDERLAALHAYRCGLTQISENQAPATPLFNALADVIREFKLPIAPFYDLLSAFSQDIEQNRYTDFHTLLDYCSRSANPVGHIVLALTHQNTPENIALSDRICTALQLINICQDIGIDFGKGRIYLPLNELQLFSLTEKDIAHALTTGKPPPMWSRFMRFQIRRARHLLLAGSMLTQQLPGRLRWEIGLTVEGGLEILRQIELQDGNVFKYRPTLRLLHWPQLLLRTMQRNGFLWFRPKACSL